MITKEYLITTHRFYFVKFNNRCLVSLIYYLATKHNISNHQPPSPPWSTATTNIINTKKKRRKEQNKKMNVFDHGMLTNLNANVRFFLYFQTFTLKPGHIHFQAL